VAVTPIPVALAVTLVGARPIDLTVMPLLPVHMPGAVFMIVPLVIILVMPVVKSMVLRCGGKWRKEGNAQRCPYNCFFHIGWVNNY